MRYHFLILALAFTSTIFAQQSPKVDFKTCDAAISFDVPQRRIMGIVEYSFELTDKKVDTIYIDARNMQFADVKINGKKAGWVSSAGALKLFKGYKKGKNSVEFSYTAKPKQTLYFVEFAATSKDLSAGKEPEEKELQIWTQGQGKYTSHWLPSFDDMNEKVVFNLAVDFEKGYTILSNGKKVGIKQGNQNNTQTVSYHMEKPMSSYLVMLAIGRFEHTRIVTASGTPLELYYRPEDSDKQEPTYRYSKQIFDFFEKEIGVNYPWDVYRQIPVLDFLYAGMENTTSTIFAQDFVVDSTGFNDRTYINVNAHELAHQWFGDMVTAKSGEHHWLQEGFATYYALLAERQLFGDDHFYYKMYEMAERLQMASRTDTIPVLNEKASSLSFYQKGAWALHVLREGVGQAAFRTAVKNYLEKYAFKNVETDEFLAEISKVSDYDTAAFKKRWLESGKFEITEAVELLSKNEFMQLYFKLGELANKRFEVKAPVFEQIMQSEMYYPVREEVLMQIAEIPFAEKESIVRVAIGSENIYVRQAVARTVTTFPDSFYDNYQSLLDDKSYITREIVLNVLYSKFPEKRKELLDLSSNWVGFNDKNLRILWLTLAYSTPGYREEQKPELYAELQLYASPRYESTVRQNALANLLYINKPDPVVWSNLVNATLHHKWQFAKFGRDNIRKLLKRDGYRELFGGLLTDLPEPERKKLGQLLAE